MPRYECQHCGQGFYRPKYHKYCSRRCANAATTPLRRHRRPPKESAAAIVSRLREPVIEELAARVAAGLPLFPRRPL